MNSHLLCYISQIAIELGYVYDEEIKTFVQRHVFSEDAYISLAKELTGKDDITKNSNARYEAKTAIFKIIYKQNNEFPEQIAVLRKNWRFINAWLNSDLYIKYQP